ncbi:MAG TPA: aldo/keto reductase, partial [Isoptericola sp.]|nr:aldo/keto reductase [Isoptericola sp.]
QGALVRDDRPLWDGFDHPTTHERLRVLREVADEIGATPNQVVLAWLLGGPVPVVPIVGAGSLAQLEEILGAAELDLDDDVRARLDAV